MNQDTIVRELEEVTELARVCVRLKRAEREAKAGFQTAKGALLDSGWDRQPIAVDGETVRVKSEHVRAGAVDVARTEAVMSEAAQLLVRVAAKLSGKDARVAREVCQRLIAGVRRRKDCVVAETIEVK